ncbi:MAG: guanylate kinase [Bacilli bacterium]|nr:guanylate kinase [Bacilli bacterium]
MKKGKFIVISGPSGVGKGTICNQLLKELNAWYSVSMTTRSMREGEVEGVNYYFVTKEEFKKRIEDGKLLEYNIYNDNYYGTPKDKVLEKLEEGINVFSEIDVNGAKNVKKIFPDALLIYIAPPSIEELKERLISRGTEDLETIENRLKIAADELKQAHFYDYVVVNDNLQDAILKIKNIINEEII